jgi:hypothetical protein
MNAGRPGRLGRLIAKFRADPEGFFRASRLAPLRAVGALIRDRRRARMEAAARRDAATRVGVILTVYNGAATLAASLQSLMAQSHGALDLIAVDDGSTDATPDILAAMAAREPRLRLIRSETRRGAYWSRNLALQATEAPFVTFHDADDVAHPNRIAWQLGLMALRPALIACLADARRLDAEGRTQIIDGRTEHMATVTLFFRREPVLQRIGYFDTAPFGADAEYRARMAAAFGAARIGRLHECVLDLLFHAESVTRSGPGGHRWIALGENAWRREMAPARRAYQAAFAAWHARQMAAGGSLYLPFPVPQRPFDLPPEMSGG